MLIIKKKKLTWLLGGFVLALVLYGIVNLRVDNSKDVIFGEAEHGMVNTATIVREEKVEEVVEVEDNIEWPNISKDEISEDQYFMVNDANLLSSAYAPEVERIPGTNMMFSVKEMQHLVDLLDFMESQGFKVHIGGAYRSYSFQTQLFNGKASQIALGYGVTDYMDPVYQEAALEARKITMFPGASEHQTGLAVDLMDRSYQKLVYENMSQEFFKVLDENCARFGFIKRYPTKKLLLTGWDEPWHYRYVGVEAATFIMEQGLCYEEFYAHYVDGFTY